MQTRDEQRHAACDECRTRKLKCSGQVPLCARCMDENIPCVYSPRKQMGRPRKKRRHEDGTGLFNSSNPGDLTDFAVEALPFPSPDLYTSTHLHNPNPPAFNLDLAVPLFGPSHRDPLVPGEEVTDVPESLANQAPYITPPSSSDNSVPTAPCACLSSMYLTLSSMQTQTSFDFPYVLPTLRAAVSTTLGVLQCEQCTKEASSTMQNLLLLTTLLTSIMDCYRKLLKSIEMEADRVKLSGAVKHFRMGDNAPERSHMHTGTLDCPMGFDVDLDGDEWRSLARKVVKVDVEGSRKESNSVLGVTTLLEERQRIWHFDPAMSEMRRHHGADQGACVPRESEWSCLKMIGIVRQHVERLGL